MHTLRPDTMERLDTTAAADAAVLIELALFKWQSLFCAIFDHSRISASNQIRKTENKATLQLNVNMSDDDNLPCLSI